MKLDHTPLYGKTMDNWRKLTQVDPVAVRDSEETFTNGYESGEASLLADIWATFTDGAETMAELLEFFRTITGDHELEWPEEFTVGGRNDEEANVSLGVEHANEMLVTFQERYPYLKLSEYEQ